MLTPKQKSSWEERFGWYHYNLENVYNYTNEDYERDAKRYYDSGTTSIILFGAHFRFSFWAYWDDIINFITKFTHACHELDMKVIEHHSSHLTYQNTDEEYWKSSSINSAVGKSFIDDFRKTSQSNPAFDGVYLDDFAQIDARTEKPALSSYIHTEGKDMDWIFKHYNGNAHCFNNPSYEKAYWKHIKDIIEKSGVDGMMNDDVQWFGGGNTCGCKYCRQKFKEETNYDLPFAEEWDDFFEDYDNPIYIAWKKFKKRSSGEFHFRMDDYYKSIGFDPIRPAYCAEVLPFDTTCYGFEPAAELWDYIFQECCGIIKYSYICFAGEAIHRFAMAKRYNVPSMALLYPNTKDSMYASWALCKSWGQMYTGTGGLGSNLNDKPYRDFEYKYDKYLNDCTKHPDISFFFSETTRDYSDKDAPKKYMKPLISFIESAYVTGLTCDMVFRNDSVDTLLKSPVIAVVSTALISDDEILRLRKYAEQGGRLLIFGDFALKDNDGISRPLGEGLKKLGLRSKLINKQYSGKEYFNFEGKEHTFDNAYSSFIFENADTIIAKGEKDQVLAVSEKLGKGEVILHPAFVSDNPIQAAIWPRGETPIDASAIPEMKNGNGKLISLCLDNRSVKLDQDDLLATVFKSSDATTIHLVNTVDMLPKEDSIGTVNDPIPAFCDDAKKADAFSICLNGYDDIITSAKIVSPEFEGSIDLSYTVKNKTITLSIPENVFAGYALIIIK